jgi:hypothetical protein
MPILTALAAARGVRLGTEVDVLKPAGDAFGCSQASPIRKSGHERRWTAHLAQDVTRFLLGQRRRDAVAPLDASQPRQVAKWPIQHIAIAERQCVKRLVLSRGSDLTRLGQLVQERFDFRSPESRWVRFPAEEDGLPDPASVAVIGATTAMAARAGCGEAIKKAVRAAKAGTAQITR